MASGLKIEYLPKIELVIVEDTTDTVAIETSPKFELAVIVAEAPPAEELGAFYQQLNPLGFNMYGAE